MKRTIFLPLLILLSLSATPIDARSQSLEVERDSSLTAVSVAAEYAHGLTHNDFDLYGLSLSVVFQTQHAIAQPVIRARIKEGHDNNRDVYGNLTLADVQFGTRLPLDITRHLQVYVDATFGVEMCHTSLENGKSQSRTATGCGVAFGVGGGCKLQTTKNSSLFLYCGVSQGLAHPSNIRARSGDETEKEYTHKDTAYINISLGYEFIF